VQLGASLDRLLAAYVGGDFEAVSKAFPRSHEFQNARVIDANRFNRWLGAWQRPKAALVLELADTSTRVAPQYTRPLLESGRRYIAAAEDGRHLGPTDRAFVQTWHRAALGMLQRGGQFDIAEAYLDALGRRAPASASASPADPRLQLARAMTTEQRCWLARPMLERPDTDLLSLMLAARMAVNDPHGPPKSVRDSRTEAHQKCLEDAVAQFALAGVAPETQAEARVRAGWVQFQLGRLDDALASLERVESNGDPVVAYWAALFRGRVLDGLRRYDAAAVAYRQALDICPTAQSAAVGLSLALFRADRIAEADALARSHRASGGGHDPWWVYPAGDERFVAQWVTELRGLIR
jgi:tetratricopeptide (TPR) repeat protein